MSRPVPFRSPRAEDNGFFPRAGFQPFHRSDAETTIAARFRAMAQRRGDALALVDGGDSLSYRQLVQRAEAIAFGLGDGLGGEPASAPGPIAVLSRSAVPMVESILGILLAGRG